MPNFRLTFESGDENSVEVHPFANNDLIIAKEFTLGTGGTGEDNEVEIQESRMTVTDISYGEVNQLQASLESGYDAPWDGAVFARVGNTSDADRQGGLYLTSDDAGAPFMDVWDDVSSWATWNGSNKVKTRVGRLDGITGATNDFGMWAGVSSTQYIKASNLGLEIHSTAALYTAYTGSQINFHDGHANPKMTIGAGNITMFKDNTTTVVGKWDSDVVTIGEVGVSKSNVYITSGAIQLRNNTTPAFEVDSSGNMEMTGRCEADMFGYRIGTLDTLDTDGTGDPGFPVLLEDYRSPTDSYKHYAIDLRGTRGRSFIRITGPSIIEEGNTSASSNGGGATLGSYITHILVDPEFASTGLRVTIENAMALGSTADIAFANPRASLGNQVFMDYDNSNVTSSDQMDIKSDGEPHELVKYGGMGVGSADDKRFILPEGGRVTFVKSKYDWKIESTTAMKPYGTDWRDHSDAPFTSDGDSGYTWLPGGTLMQWGIKGDGTSNDLGNTESVVFPIAFPNHCHVVFGTIGNIGSDTGGGDHDPQAQMDTLTTTGVTFSVATNYERLYWFAIGN